MIRLEIHDGAVVHLHVGGPPALLAPAAEALPAPRASGGRRLLTVIIVLLIAGGAYQAGRWDVPSGETVPPARAAAPAAAPSPGPDGPIVPRPAASAPWRAFPDAPLPAPASEATDGTAALRRALQTPPTVLPPAGTPGPAGTAPGPAPARNAFGLQVPLAP